MKRLCFSLLAVLSLALPAKAQDRARIDALNAKFEAAVRTRDTSAIANMYAEDAFLLPPGSELVRGRAGIQGFWAKSIPEIEEFRLSAADVKPLGSDALREVGTFRLRMKGGQQPELVGKYVVIWEKSGGDWKLATDIWNLDK